MCHFVTECIELRIIAIPIGQTVFGDVTMILRWIFIPNELVPLMVMGLDLSEFQ